MASFQKYSASIEKFDRKEAMKEKREYYPPDFKVLFSYKPYEVSMDTSEEIQQETLDNSFDNSFESNDEPVKKIGRHVRFQDEDENDHLLDMSIAINSQQKSNDEDFIEKETDANYTLDHSEELMIYPPSFQQLPPTSYEVQSFYDLIILSPPWSGPHYLDYEEYDLRTMLSCGDGYYLACLTASVVRFFVMILPRNTPNKSITQLCNLIHYQVIIETIHLHNKCKVKVCYFYYAPQKK